MILYTKHLSIEEFVARALIYAVLWIGNNHNLMGNTMEERRMFPYDKRRKPGRPKAIPESFVPKVIALYKRGFGYRAITRELKKKNLLVNWSTVRRLIKKKLWTNLSCKYNPYPNLTPSNSINKDQYRQGITCSLKKSESNQCLVKPVDLPRVTCKYEGKH